MRDQGTDRHARPGLSTKTPAYAAPMPAPLVLVSVGNTRTRLACVEDNTLQPSIVLESDNAEAIAAAIAGLLENAPADSTAVLASVNAPAANAIETALLARDIRVLRFGRELEIPIITALTDDSTVGQDRLLDAMGAFARSKQACVVIDAGTAVTVDFVDGEGVFQGGAIAPGLSMMLDALHEKTAALPSVRLSPELLPAKGPDDPVAPPFGKHTSQAMVLGALAAVRGMVHHLIDAYAEYYEAYPRVIATGGDAPMLFENDPLVELVVPDLALVGMLEAVRTLESLEESDDDPGV